MELNEVKRLHDLSGKYPQLNDDEIKELQKLANNLSGFLSDVIYEMEIRD